MILSMKNLVFKRPAKNMTEQYIRLYTIKKVISINTIKLKLLIWIMIYLMVNIIIVVRFRKPVKEKKVKKLKLVEIYREEE